MDPWACQLFSGLADLHSIDVIHRNINPHKLLLSQDDLKIAGLGVFAFIAHNPTSQAKVAEFAAPEVVEEREREQTTAVDVWSTRCTPMFVLFGPGAPRVSSRISLGSEQRPEHVPSTLWELLQTQRSRSCCLNAPQKKA